MKIRGARSPAFFQWQKKKNKKQEMSILWESFLIFMVFIFYNPLTTGVKQAVPYRTGREARYLSVSTDE